ncbi:hypothetical protein Dsin_031320 [Dipteronia sinensis]|uniref:RING-type E3 ubiquitin transferase n=1 Tax=Dipteronia sinensis TaxID=43782 RepID=A0AAD9ZMN7_9ROSI|nr:hypothetical protein Dsin_031320 [Dipteronia sinensis]
MGENDDDQGPFTGYGGHHNPYDLNSKIMLTAIISLSFVVIVVMILHIYARCILRRQARRRATFHTLDLTADQPHAHYLPGAEPKTGLDPLVIASLPIFVFQIHPADDGQNGTVTTTTETECAVCLSNLENQEMARMLPNCNHTFHAECIDKWLGSHSTCPICRTEAEPRLLPEPREGPVAASSVTPTAPLLDGVNSTLSCAEESSSSAAKVTGGSSSRLSSFRKILSRERSSRRLQSSGQEDDITDLERQ